MEHDPPNLDMPERKRLREIYDAVIIEIDAKREADAKLKGSVYISLTKGFYAETGDAVFDAAYLALTDYYNQAGAARVHVVSAPAGGGKTSFSYAFMVAVTRYFSEAPNEAYGCVFVVDQIEKAEQAYKELNELAPGSVAVWTTEHDAKCKPQDRKRVRHPTAVFTQDELQQKPIAVVTHNFYNGKNGYKALNVRHPETKRLPERALVMVDERPEEVEVYETTLKDAQRVRELLEAKRPDLRTELDKLNVFLMCDNWTDPKNTIRRHDAHFGQDFVGNQLEWFATKEADLVVRDHRAHVPGIESVFGLAKAMTQGCAFTSQSGTVIYYVGWRPKIRLRHGTVLLDATADIDGITQLCPWREHTKVPQADYSNLEIIHVPQHTKRRTSEYLKTAANQRAYANWMVETIKLYMKPGERGLVICKKVLFDQERIPQWPEDHAGFKDPDSYQKRYEWEIEGRKLCAIHYGTGIGRNDWRDADVVFMFDEFFIPKRTAIANVQGLGGHNAYQGPLASMTTLNSKSEAVKIFIDGHRLRWTKQLALRGKGRSYDEDGRCGGQRLVISNDLRNFSSHVGRLFPGAKPQYLGQSADSDTWGEKVIKALSISASPELTSTQLSRLISKTWGSISTRVLTPDFHRSLASIGREYVPGKGRRVSVFKKIDLAKAA